MAELADIAVAMVDGEAIEAEIIADDSEGRLVVITAEPESTEAADSSEATAEAEVQPEDSELAKKPAHKGKGKKGAATADSAGK